MKLLVTGGAGFIGTNFIYYWLKEHSQDKINVIDALTYAGNIENLRPVLKKIKFFEADINDRAKVSEAMRGVDAVVHFAAESHVDRSIFDPSRYWQTNVRGTAVLLEEAIKLKVPRFHHISTDEVYGELPLNSKEKFTEKTPYAPRPDNLYALSKAEADNLVLSYVEKTGMFITISNCSNNYGPYQFPEKFIPIAVTNLIDGIKVPIHGDGRNIRDWIHTSDHASAIDLILEKGKRGETYLVGSNNDHDNKYIAEKIVTLSDKGLDEIRHVPDRHSNDRRYAIDATKIITELGWKPKIGRNNFDDGLKETINWYKDHQDWWRPLLKRRAMITDDNRTISAFITLDRETGKTKFIFGKFEEREKPEVKKSDLKEHFVEENLVRYEIVMKNLKSKRWFRESSENVQKEIETLVLDPETFGYVEDLASREDKVGDEKVLRLSRIDHGQPELKVHSIISWFEVEDKSGNKKQEGYYSWGLGPKSGAKFLVLVRRRGKITHLALRRVQKFPRASIVYDLVGGLPRLNQSLMGLIVNSLDKDLGVKIKNGDARLDEVISLGRVATDSGMTNNYPNLYAIIIDLAEDKYANVQIGDTFEEEVGVVLWPIEKLSEIVNSCDESYFLSALTRLVFNKVFDIKIR